MNTVQEFVPNTVCLVPRVRGIGPTKRGPEMRDSASRGPDHVVTTPHSVMKNKKNDQKWVPRVRMMTVGCWDPPRAVLIPSFAKSN